MARVGRRMGMGWASMQMRMALWSAPPVAFYARRTYANFRSEYGRNGACRGAIDGTLAFLMLLLVDRVFGWPLALRMVYILPIWFVAQRAGRVYGTIMVLITTCTLTAIDSHVETFSHGGILASLLTHGVVLYGLMRIMEEMEARVKQYSNLATRDPLTGLANRLALDEFARRSIERCCLTMEPLAIGMVDCDRFKQLNDAYGHPFGDLVLKTLAKCLKKALPPEALVARTGGDEFVIVLPGRSGFELRKYLDGAQVRFLSQSVLEGRCAGFSFGTAAFGIDRKSYEVILAAADMDMYLGKSGRAAVEFGNALVA